LALEVASQLATTYPDGWLEVDLSTADGNPPDLQDAIVGLLYAQGWPAKDVAGLGPADRARRYRAWFEGKRALVLIRNATSAAQVEALAPGSSTSAVIVTSDTDLPGLAANLRCRLGPLSVRAAVELLARFSGRDEVTGDPASVWLADWFGCHPLLLRCVGAWMGHPARINVPVASLAKTIIDKGPPVAPGMDRELLRRLRRCAGLVPP
jgi:hypothetical protein